MITARSKGFQLLDSNIEVFRAGIERILDRTKGPEWKSSFAKRKGEYYKKFVETKEIDYNLIPALVSDYPNSFDNGAWLKQDVLLDLVSSVRDLRNLIAHHAEFNEHSLRVLTESLRGAFKMLNLGSRFQELDNQRIPNSTVHIKGSAFTRKVNNPKNDGYINIPPQDFEDVDVPF